MQILVNFVQSKQKLIYLEMLNTINLGPMLAVWVFDCEGQ